MQKKDISKCPEVLEAVFKEANSLPMDYETLSIDIFLREEIEVDKKRFYKIIKTLPKEFIELYPWLQAVLESKTTLFPVATWLKNREKPDTWWVQWEINSYTSTSFNPLHSLISEISRVQKIQKSLIKAVELGVKSRLPSPYALHRQEQGKHWKPLYGPENPPPPESPYTLEDIHQMRINEENRLKESQIIKLDSRSLPFRGYEVVEGIIEPRHDTTFTVLINERIDVRRIGLCPICKNFFWAKRMGAKTCGKKQCVDILSQRRAQLENKEEISRAKRKKYYLKKNIDFCPDCIRPESTCECT